MPLHFKITVMFGIKSIIVILYAVVPTVFSNERTAYSIIIGLAMLLGACMAILQSACYGVAGPSAQLMDKFNLGVGVSGLAINTLRIVVLATLSDFTVIAYVFFCGTGAFLILCTVLALRFVREFSTDQVIQRQNK